MTPAARVQAAVECLDLILAGQPAEQVLTGWARRSRFAGSKDRAAVRDHVFDALRCRRSFAALGGAETGRGLMLGALRSAGIAPETMFTGDGYGPSSLNDAELEAGRDPDPGAEEGDIPDWIWPLFVDTLGDEAAASAAALRHRAPVHLRVNAARTTPEAAMQALHDEGIETSPHAASPHALEIRDGARKLRQSEAYRTGLVELQDAASQAVVMALPLGAGMRVLDYCAGGGGKSLALAAQPEVKVFAHDAAPERLRDLDERAARAGASVEILSSNDIDQSGPFDIVLCDVPCSGSGAWRRAPDGKWRLTPERLEELRAVQAGILDEVMPLVAPGGILAYATCSLLSVENEAQIDAFLSRNPGWRCTFRKSWPVTGGTDGFFSAHLTRD